MMEISAKVCILGQSNVGKTSLLQRYLSNQFHQQHAATIGAAFARKEIYVDEDTSVLLEMWDTAGQERFRSMAPQYFRGCSIGICVFQCDDMKSLDTLRGWVSELQRHALDDLEIVMVASKCDVLLPTLSSSSSSSSSVALSNKNGHGSSKSSKSTSKSKSSPGNGVNGNSRDAEVAQRVMQEAERMAKDLSAPRVALTSAKTGQGIVKLFQTVTQLALRQDAKRQHMHRDEVIGGISQPSRSIILGSLRVETREQDGCCR